MLEEMNGSTVCSKLDMNIMFQQIELEEGSRDILSLCFIVLLRKVEFFCEQCSLTLGRQSLLALGPST